MLRTPPAAWTVPVLETERLRLRAHTLNDFDTYCDLWADPAVVRYLSCLPNTREESMGRLLRNAGHWTLRGFGSWLVEEKASGEFVGEVGLFNYLREIQPRIDETPEIGWILSPHKHGLGYATEAVRSVLDWGRDRFTAGAVCCLIDPENTASLRVAEKSGFHSSHTARYRGRAIEVLKRVLRTQT
jgi:RimJ/RimL family protein N-acetyltransferase